MPTRPFDSFHCLEKAPQITSSLSLNLMAKDQSSKSLARSSYEKISKATFGTLRRISHRPKNDNSPSPSQSTTDAPAAKARVSYTQPPTSGEEVRTPSRSSRPPEVKQPLKKLVRFSSSNTKKAGDGGGKALAGQQTFGEEKYSSYIDHTKMKMKMKAPSDVRGGRTVSRRESFNDKFASYISRTRLKLRTTSGIGADEKNDVSSK